MRLTTLATALAIAGIAAGGALAQGQKQQGAAGAQPQGTQNGAFCLEGGQATAKNCSFATMAACDAAKKEPTAKCAPNAARTTGSGAAGSSSKPMTSPSK